MTDEEIGKCFEDMFDDKEYIERIKNTCLNHKLFNTVAYINKLEKENKQLSDRLQEFSGCECCKSLHTKDKCRSCDDEYKLCQYCLYGYVEYSDDVETNADTEGACFETYCTLGFDKE